VSAPVRQEWFVPTMPKPVSHYTHAVSYGDLVFVSGCTGTNANNELVGGDDVEAQTEQVLSNLEQALGAAGSSLKQVLSVTVYLTDIRDRERVNVPRQKRFGEIRPASTLVEVSKLVTVGAKVEIDVIAHRSASSADASSEGTE
jgi:2-iminobutanoate/2-iminopropanoate deaminase